MIMATKVRPATDIRGSVLAMSEVPLSPAPHDRVLANMVIGSNGATCLHRDSAPLSPPADRERFHQIRALASALVVGGSTYRLEHYENAPLPVFVATRDNELLSRNGKGGNPRSQFFNAAPHEVVDIALAQMKSPVLVEGGISFLTPLLKARLIDLLFLTRSPIAGDSDYFDSELLESLYEIEQSERIDDVLFEQWRPKKPRS